MKDYSSYFNKREILYFNSASSGIPTKNGILKAHELLDKISTEGDVPLDSYFSTIENCRKEIAKLVNCKPNSIGLIPNTTSAVHLIKNGFSEIKKIIIYGKNFPCTLVPFQKDDRYSVEIITKNPENLDKELSKYKKTLVFVDLVDYLTGEIVDLNLILEIVHNRNSLLAVDAIQGAGSVVIDLSKTPVDFLFAGASKWLLGPQGIGFFYIDEQHIDKIVRRNCGWLSLDYKNFDSFENLPEYRLNGSGIESGTRNFFGILLMGENLKFLNSVGIENVYSHNIEGIKQIGKILENFGFISQNLIDIKTPILSFKTRNTKNFYNYLIEKNVKVSFRDGMVRFAFHIFNYEDEVKRLKEIVDKFIF
ncbi:MAG: aminotransferase class V-fold PLP-dependent enzyme [candidate division WOR-3 bacterium]